MPTSFTPTTSTVSIPGYVYILINPTIPGLVKVGRTTRAPAERVAELSSATGVPSPFELVYDVLVPDCVLAERIVHQALEQRGYRHNDQREFFRAPIREVVGLLVLLREQMDRQSVSVAEPLTDEEAAGGPLEPVEERERDQLFSEAAAACRRAGMGSTSLLQRELRIGYGRAARIVDQLHAAGILGPPDGANPREVLDPGHSDAPSERPKSGWRLFG